MKIMKKVIYKKLLGQPIIAWIFQIAFIVFLCLNQIRVLGIASNTSFILAAVIIIGYLLSIAGYLGYKRK
ncbi:hypothetical protein [Oenococcus oeni]|uniref:hypothetical protein n=2 Tax=Oenococcus oeni TaxID=1247 RepID=UPI00214CF8DB|nr:hypothetical protein [Oenococcus oeni]